MVLVAMLGIGVAEHTGFINAALRAGGRDNVSTILARPRIG